MAQTYNVQIEDSEGNKYCPKPDLLTTKEQLAANNAAGKSVDALVVKEINNNLNSHPQFIYDSSGKITGYKTKAGADTVFPFNDREIDIQTGTGKTSITLTFADIPRLESYLVVSSEKFSYTTVNIAGTDLVSCEEVSCNSGPYAMCNIYKVVTAKIGSTINVTKKYDNTYGHTYKLVGILF